MGTAAHVPSDQTCLIYPNMLSVRNNFIGGLEIYQKDRHIYKILLK